MNRRGFLQLLGMGAAGAMLGVELDPERLLWVPGAKTIFLPPPPERRLTHGAWVPHDWIAKETLRMLEEKLAFSRLINREYDAAWVTGQAITLSIPLRYTAK
jgi:hypothetical protein